MTINNNRLLESLADIAYYAGESRYFTGNSRADVSEFIRWAKEFEEKNKDEDWDSRDYILEIREFFMSKIDKRDDQAMCYSVTTANMS